jgi:hypothetical protein
MDADPRTELLLDTLRRYQEMRCREVDDAARAQARDIMRQARREGRARLHEALQAERKRAAERIRAAQARLETVTRQRRHAHARRLTEAGWDLLAQALRARWADAHARRLWCEGLLRQAMETLRPGEWRIEHPADWKPEGLEALLDEVRATAGAEPVLAACDDVPIGLRVRARGACVDGTLAGVRAERMRIEAELLGECALLDHETR